MADVLPFDTNESRRRRNGSTQANAGRKWFHAWRREVGQQRLAGKLIDFDLILADALGNFPSSTLHGCLWPAQTTLAETLNRSVSTIERAVGRFKRAGLIQAKQRGNGRSAIYTFCLDGKALFPAAAPASVRGLAPLNLKELRGSAPASVREESCYSTESCKRESPQSPPQAPEQADPPEGQPIKEAGPDAVHHGEVLRPEGEIEFKEFWRAIRQNPGQLGPALAQWGNLSRADRHIIGSLIERDGLDLGGVWASTWLKGRLFEQAPIRTRWQEACDELRSAVRGADPTGAAVGGYETLQPYSERWNAERARKVAAGESVKLMESWAKADRGWDVRRGGRP